MRRAPLLLAAAAGVAAAAPPAPVSGSETRCVAGRRHTVRYAAQLRSDRIASLDADPATNNLMNVVCGDDGSLTLQLRSPGDAAPEFVVGAARRGCGAAPVLRRVVSAGAGGALRTAPARYDDIFASADISFAAGGSCGDPVPCPPSSPCDIDKRLCFGYNTDCDACSATGCTPSRVIPLYSSNASKPWQATMSCSDCWAAANVDVYADLRIGGLSVLKASAGFRGAGLNASLLLDGDASAGSSAAADKNVTVFPPVAYNFTVAGVPFQVSLDAPMEIKADQRFSAGGVVSFGATAGVFLGAASVSWDVISKWKHSVAMPGTPVFTPVLSGPTADVDMSGHLSLVPALNLRFDHVLSYSLTANPAVSAAVRGTVKSRQVCLTSEYSMDIVSEAKLEAKVPPGVKCNPSPCPDEWTYQKTIGSWHGQPLPEMCLPHNKSAVLGNEQQLAGLGDFILGFANGLGTALNLTACAKDWVNVRGDVSAAVQFFESGFNLKDPQAIAEALKLTGSVFSDLGDAIQLCAADEGGLAKKLKVIAGALQGNKLDKLKIEEGESIQLVTERRELTADAAAFVKGWRGGDSASAGRALGDIAGILVEGA